MILHSHMTHIPVQAHLSLPQKVFLVSFNPLLVQDLILVRITAQHKGLGNSKEDSMGKLIGSEKEHHYQTTNICVKVVPSKVANQK